MQFCPQRQMAETGGVKVNIAFPEGTQCKQKNNIVLHHAAQAEAQTALLRFYHLTRLKRPDLCSRLQEQPAHLLFLRFTQGEEKFDTNVSSTEY